MLSASSILSLSTTLLVLLLSRWFIDELRRRTSLGTLRCAGMGEGICEGEEGGGMCEGEEGGGMCEGEEGGGMAEGEEGAETLLAPATVAPLPTVTVRGGGRGTSVILNTAPVLTVDNVATHLYQPVFDRLQYAIKNWSQGRPWNEANLGSEVAKHLVCQMFPGT